MYSLKIIIYLFLCCLDCFNASADDDGTSNGDVINSNNIISQRGQHGQTVRSRIEIVGFEVV